jgi:hypothetical protein
MRRGIWLVAVVIGMGLIEGVLATEIAGVAVGVDRPVEHMLLALATVGLLGLPGAAGSSALVAHALSRFVPDPRKRALRDGARALGLEIVLDVPGYFVAAGTYEGRGVRLELSGLRRRLTAAISAEARGYGLLTGGPPQGMDRDWLQSIQQAPVGARSLQLLGARVLLLPTQLHATGHDGWLESPEILQERVRALLDLAQIAERLPPSRPEGTGSLQRWASALPDPRTSPNLELFGTAIRLATAGLGLTSVLWLGFCGLLGVLWIRL